MSLPHDIHNEYVRMIQDLKPNLAVTLNTYPGCSFSNHRMLKKLKLFDAQIADKIFGRRWENKPDDMRMQGIFVLEHGKQRNHPHWHGFLSVPEDQLYRYYGLTKSIWARNHWKAWAEINNKSYADNAGYILKEVTLDTTDRIVFTNMLRA